MRTETKIQAWKIIAGKRAEEIIPTWHPNGRITFGDSESYEVEITLPQLPPVKYRMEKGVLSSEERLSDT